MLSLSNLIQACWAADPARRPSFNEIVQHLNYIIVDCAILDNIGRQFWKQFFLEKVKKTPINSAFKDFHQGKNPLE